MNTLEKLLQEVIADGKIDASEVGSIRAAVYDDGIIDAEEVDFLFDVNDAVSGNNNDPGWEALFVEAVASNILADGTIDEEETAMLVAKIQGDGAVDPTEKALLLHLKKIAPEFPAELEALLE